MSAPTTIAPAPETVRKAPSKAVPFGVNEVRLNPRQWLLAASILLLVVLLTPWLWRKIEKFETGPDYRIPYQLSKDYWLYQRRLAECVDGKKIMVLGDSVVWGEYVLPDGTLSHFLNREAGESDRFINAGVNGLFPLAQEGLVRNYSSALRHQKVIVQCNVLWLTSPKADLSTRKEEQFNHARLVPQFSPWLPCYRADASERLSAVIENHVGFFAWVSHLQNAYFEQKSLLQWTLANDGASPLRYPNASKNPFAQVTLRVPSAPADDPQRGPKSSRHKPWSENNQGATRFDWVSLDASLQWGAFQRVIGLLRAHDNQVLVLLGPFNEHLLAEENRPAYQQLRAGIAAWLKQNQIPCVLPDALPSALYADASHPLTEGYALLAQRLCADADFQGWLRK